MKKAFFLSLLIVMLVLPISVFAQDAPLNVETVSIATNDDLALIGDYYRPAGDAPRGSILLLHMLGNRRQSWAPLIPALVEANFAVLAIDMRGHGETGGLQDWALAEDDTQILIDWLREQAPDAPVGIVGASIGSNMALRGMANDAEVVTAVALSPGLDYRGVTTDDAVTAIGERPLFLVASRNDNPSGSDTQALFDLATGETQFRLYNGRIHGTGLFVSEPTIVDLVSAWLVEQFD